MICLTICCLHTSAGRIVLDRNDGSRDDSACITQYLKNKGKLANDFPSVKASSVCRFIVVEIVRIVGEIVKGRITKEMPNDVDCIVKEYERNQLVDNLLKIALIVKSDKLTVAGKITALEIARDELKEQKKVIGATCGLEVEKFSQVLDKILEPQRNETIA